MATTLQISVHMNSGKGEKSYANNSSLQRNAIHKTRPILEETITRLFNDSPPNCMKVADLGCSVGQNAFVGISNIIEIVDTISSRLNREPPTFQFYLNDLFGNDFNTTFKSLPDFYKKLEEEKGHKFGSCFINATPGSFYGRLFPNNSINLFHCANSLHWLSQDPLLGKESSNKGHIHIVSTSPPEVYKAYLKQFQQDFKLFLKSRSEELVPGGAMVLFSLGRNETSKRNPTVLLSQTLHEMFLEGLIEEAKLDSFNVPTYEPTIEEIRHVIQEEGSFFLQRLEILPSPDQNEDCDGNIIAEVIAKHLRAATEPLFSTVFDVEIINELFIRFPKKIVQVMQVEKLEFTTWVMSMTKIA